MGENASKIGNKLEGFGENLVSDLGWIELIRDKEIKCQRSSHKKKTHGIDLLCKFNNPYLNGNQGIIIECKNRQMRSITKSDIEEWVKELINNIECSQSTDELSDIDLSDIKSLNTGLLLIHANDQWDEAKFYRHLNSLSVANRRNPINVFVAGNDRINLWTSLLAKIKKDFQNGFSFIYPSLNEFSKKLQRGLTINAMFSKYLFAESTYTIQMTNEAGSYEEPHRQTILFFFDEINPDNFKYAWSMFKHYQLQGAEKYTFVFYPRKNGDVDYVNSCFIQVIKAGDPNISDGELNKICLDFIDNRTLSPIEIGGVK